MDSSRTAPSLIKRHFFFPPPSLCPCRRREEHIFLVDQPFCSSFPLRPRLCLFRSLSFPALHVIIIALKMKITISISLYTIWILSVGFFFFISLTYVNIGCLAAYFYSQVLLFFCPRLFLGLRLLPLMQKAVREMFPPWARFYKANPLKERKRNK